MLTEQAWTFIPYNILAYLRSWSNCIDYNAGAGSDMENNYEAKCTRKSYANPVNAAPSMQNRTTALSRKTKPRYSPRSNPKLTVLCPRIRRNTRKLLFELTILANLTKGSKTAENSAHQKWKLRKYLSLPWPRLETVEPASIVALDQEEKDNREYPSPKQVRGWIPTSSAISGDNLSGHYAILSTVRTTLIDVWFIFK